MGQVFDLLNNSGFFSALGTIERYLGEDRLVRRGTPLTHGRNNGILVIYDDQGWPWVILARKLSTRWWIAMSFNTYHNSDLVDFRPGAYVPHSNDGGHFMLEILPDLLRN